MSPKHEGIARVIYLGGLGDQPRSKHLRSRQETARQLEACGPPLTYFRAGMVVGSESESYRTLRYLVGKRPRPKVPVPFITPWLSSLWIGLVIEGLSTEKIVTDDSARQLFDIEPAPFEATLRQALAEDKDARAP